MRHVSKQTEDIINYDQSFPSLKDGYYLHLYCFAKCSLRQIRWILSGNNNVYYGTTNFIIELFENNRLDVFKYLRKKTNLVEYLFSTKIIKFSFIHKPSLLEYLIYQLGNEFLHPKLSLWLYKLENGTKTRIYRDLESRKVELKFC